MCVAALAFVREGDLPIAVRAGGHSVAGRRIVRAGGGAVRADLYRATQAQASRRPGAACRAPAWPG